MYLSLYIRLSRSDGFEDVEHVVKITWKSQNEQNEGNEMKNIERQNLLPFFGNERFHHRVREDTY